MPRLIVILDANVLIPAAPRDTLLRAAEHGLYQVRWSEPILNEVERNLVENGMTSAEDARGLIAAMRSFFPEALVTGFDELIPAMTNDPKNRHVLAAAVHAGVDIIVTENVNDFPDAAVGPYHVVVQPIEAFLVDLYDGSPEMMIRIIQEQAADLDAPPMTPYELLDTLSAWTPMFSQSVRKHL